MRFTTSRRREVFVVLVGILSLLPLASLPVKASGEALTVVWQQPINLVQNQEVSFSFRARSLGSFPLYIAVQSPSAALPVGFFVAQTRGWWQFYSASLTPQISDGKASILFLLEKSTEGPPVAEIADLVVSLPQSLPRDVQLVWADEFDQPTLDSEKWNIEHDQEGYQGCCLSYGLGQYSAQALSIHNGILRITSDQNARSYTSGALTTEDKFAWQFGRLDIRAKLPAGQGLWPAFWMLPSGNEEHEIDVMEMLGHEPNRVYMTIHEGESQTDQCEFAGPDFSVNFHTFSLIWTAHDISWLVDEKVHCHTTKSIPHENMYLLINTAIGGNWPGNPDASTSFPQVLEVDYIRVFQE